MWIVGCKIVNPEIAQLHVKVVQMIYQPYFSKASILEKVVNKLKKEILIF